MIRGESEGESRHKVKGKAEKAAKNKVERSEIPADKTSKPMKEVAPKEGRGKWAALTKVILLFA